MLQKGYSHLFIKKHQFKATPKLKTYDGESLDLGMNFKAKFPTNDKSLDLSGFHKDIFLVQGVKNYLFI
jgi:hypothetical protein